MLLVKRPNEPFKGEWALPGGFIWETETSILTAKRILKDKVGISDVYTEQLYTFDEKGRDPRGKIISISYFALVSLDLINKKNDEYEPTLFPVKGLPKLAFDHDKITKYALKRVRAKIEYTNVAFSLLPKEFTLTELQKVYEIILGTPQDKRNFRRKYQSLGLIEETTSISKGKHRPAKLYRFIKRTPVELQEKIF